MDDELIVLGERFEKLLLEQMDAWLEWAPRMRAALAEVRDNTAALAVAVKRTGCDVAQARMSELEQPIAEEIIAAPAISVGGCALRRLWPCGRHFRPTPPIRGHSISRTHHGRCSMRLPS
jgi:hypothetical protein